MIGRDKRRKYWRVLKIDKSNPSKLVFFEDPTVYSFSLCKALLQDIKEANKKSGGLKFVTYCYGIVGFIRLLGPYYVILITKRRKIGQIFDHPIYTIAEYKIIPFAQPTFLSMDEFERENRYKKLLELVDLRKDYYFSYSYPIMHSLQANLSHNQTEQDTAGTKFVWNENLTRKIRDKLKSSHWTVALLHGFFKQVRLSARGKTFKLTLIARRSCQFAGTRYQKRGVDEKGHAANHVEIEQIVCEEISGEGSHKCTSAVQNRGSIPLFWSQNPSLLNPKPDIIFSDEGSSSDEATELHFQNLRLRYGDPLIILNLTKVDEMHPESLLHNAFNNAVECINKDMDKENQLTLWNLDLNTEFRTEGSDVLSKLKDVATNALSRIGFFSCQAPQSVNFKASFDLSCLWINGEDGNLQKNKYQNGVLRTNCLDSIDRTNVAQYVYGFVALDQQLDALEITDCSVRDSEHILAKELMRIYEAMGNALARQYGGSAAHSQIFAKSRGRCPAATLIQKCVISIQRHYSNAFIDVRKQQAIDIFLGNFKPADEPASFRSNPVEKRGNLNALCLQDILRILSFN
ncbi:phosphoinositide phosphatase SAC2-like isoform X2 [Silene latifolia]